MAEIVARTEQEITVQVTLKLSGSLMEMENSILDACNEVGCLGTEEAFSYNSLAALLYCSTALNDFSKN